METQPINRLDVLDAMIRYGGGFVSRLGEAWLRADDDNDRRLREAFPHYWEQYEAVARQQRARAAIARARGEEVRNES